MEAVLFYALAAVTLISGVFVVFLRRPVHNVLFMILTMIGLACLFILLHAEFLAMVQIIVYAGAIMVLFLFVIMLLNLDEFVMPPEKRRVRYGAGIVLAMMFVVFLIPASRGIVSTAGPVCATAAASGLTNTEIIAQELFTTYLLPFEIASVLLLAAIVGTVIIGKKSAR